MTDHTITTAALLDVLDPAEFTALSTTAAARLAALVSAGQLSRTATTLALLLTVFPAGTASGGALTALFGGKA